MRIPPRPNLPPRDASSRSQKPAAQDTPPTQPNPLDDGPIVPMRTDVCIYGATAAGLVAAAAVSKAGYPVLLIEPGRYLGGLLSAGLCRIDPAAADRLQGITREMLTRIGQLYGRPLAQCWEPGIAEAVCNDLSRDHNLTVLFCHRLTEVKKTDNRITELLLDRVISDEFNAPARADEEDERTSIVAKVYLDCSYEGDLMAMSGGKFTTLPTALAFHPCLTSNPSNRRGIELVSQIQSPAGSGAPGRTDCGELCPTASGALATLPFQLAPLPHAKAQFTLHPDLAQRLWSDTEGYLDADFPRRGEIWQSALGRLAALLVDWSGNAEVPEPIRREMSAWSLCADEFPGTQGWPHQPELIGGRRLQGTIPPNPNTIAVDISGQPIPLDAVLPLSIECQNLLVPVCSALGSTDEFTRMSLAESTAVLATLACEDSLPVQFIPHADLLATLRTMGIEV